MRMDGYPRRVVVHTQSVIPAYAKRPVAKVKFPSRIDHPRTGQATILDNVNAFGIVYIFSRTVAFLGVSFSFSSFVLVV